MTSSVPPLSRYRLVVPPELAEIHADHPEDVVPGWTERLPDLADELLDRWGLTPDGRPAHGMIALVLPVRQADGTPAALKLQPITADNVGEPAALRTWNGEGAVNLLRHDPGTGSMLLERLDAARTLGPATVPDETAALTVLTELLGRLTRHAAPPGIRCLADIAAGLLADAPDTAAAMPTPEDARLVADCAAAVREVVGEPGDRLLHWDLHYDNVLGGAREPWLAIDPQPISGDPCFDLLPAIDNRWEEAVAGGDVAASVRRRFDLMTDHLGLDRQRARRWTLGRVLQNLIWGAEGGDPVDRVQTTVARVLLADS